MATERHAIHPNLVSDRVRVALVGCGGNGSQMLTGLARLDHALRALQHPGFDVTVYDPDAVSAANIARQMFAPGDIGRNKATCLVNRVNAFFGLSWAAVPRAIGLRELATGILITCVDTRSARAYIARRLELRGRKPYYWMDLGNRAADGQVVLGCPPWTRDHANPKKYWLRLPTVVEILPEIADTRIREDNTPSCSLAEALERQHLFVNQAVVTPALELLWQLFRQGWVDWHGAFVNLASGRVQPMPVDCEAWGRLRQGNRK